MSTRTCNLVPANPAPYLAQDGWIYDEHGMTRKPRMAKVEYAFGDTICRYDQQATDKECPADCPRRNKGEAE